MSDVFETMKEGIIGMIKKEVEKQVEARLSAWEQKMEQAFATTTTTTTSPSDEKTSESPLPNVNDRTEKVSPDAQKLYQYLRQYRKEHKDEDPDATPSYKVIREKTELTSNKVSDAYNELESQNIIARKPKGRAKIVEFAPMS